MGVWPEIAEQVSPSLAREDQGGPEHYPEITLETMDSQSRRAPLVRCHIFAIDEADRVEHLLVLQHGDAAASIDASLRHATRQRGMSSLYRDTAHDLKGMLDVIKLLRSPARGGAESGD